MPRKTSSYLLIIGFILIALYHTYKDNYDSCLDYGGKWEYNWYDDLRPCPCINPDMDGIVNAHDGWAREEASDNESGYKYYHRGAKTCFRSYPPVKTSEGMSGQQCCYDEKGYLITCGAGAGTPDKFSICINEDENGIVISKFIRFFDHFVKDVIPWMRKGWKKYNECWHPNNANDCLYNCVPDEDCDLSC